MPDHVLVVEDDLMIASHVAYVLTRAGFRSRLASNGQEALLLLEEYGAPLFVVTELVMPRMGGVELAAAMKQDRRWCEVSVLAMSDAVDSLTPHGASLFSGFLKPPFVDHEGLQTLLLARTDPPAGDR